MKILLKFLRRLAAVGSLMMLALGLAEAQSTYTNPYVVNVLAGTVGAAGSANGSPGLFSFPFGIAVDGAGNVYVGDTYNDTIRKITSAGVMSTLAGSVGVSGSTNGTGTGALFNNPEGVAVDASGNVYVADISNNTIRKITAAGVVTTLAGTAGTSGSTDGTGGGALFNGPAAVAVDSSGNVYVADTYNDTIRKITSGGVVTTFAGVAGSQGSTDGTGGAARFYLPSGIAVDSSGNVYVADTYNDTIREITSTGAVTTLAGTAGSQGSADGTGAAARFYLPIGIAVDSSDNVYVADTYNDTIRRMTSARVVSTLAGQAGVKGSINGSGNGVQFNSPYGVAVDGAQDIYVADSLNVVVRKGTPVANLIQTQPQNQSVNAGATAAFSVTGIGSGLSYQWYLNGVAIAGATGTTLTLANVSASQAGSYTVIVTNGTGSDVSSAATLTVSASARLINLSARASLGTGGNILIAGFALGGSGSKQLLLRAAGPRLASDPFDVAGTLSHPQMTLIDNSQTAIATDIGWGNSPTLGTSTVQASPQMASAALMNQVGAFSFPTGSADSAMAVTPPVSNYTIEVSGVNGTSGIALAEIYDADTGTPTARLINLSARANVGSGGNILIGGFAITGSTSETVLIRGAGPRLQSAPFDLTGTLAAPQLTLIDGNNNVIATNVGWGNSSTLGNSTVQAGIQPATIAAMDNVGAFEFTPGSADSAMIASLPPGNYTLELSGAGNTSGIGLVEIYEIP